MIHLENLKTLNLDHNYIENPPESLGMLTSLVTLNFNDNKLLSLPNSLINLKNLKHFEVWNNRF